MNYSTAIQDELDQTGSDSFIRGEYIYMGMGKLGKRTVCIAVAYKIDYCIKKAVRFAEEDPNITFDHINKVKTGEVIACSRFEFKIKNHN